MKIIITNDNNLKQISKNVYLKTFEYNAEPNQYAIAPFSPEHYNDVDLVAHKILADQNHTKIVALHTLNYLPVLSKISHQALMSNYHGLQNAYELGPSTIHNQNPLKIPTKNVQDQNAFTNDVKNVPIEMIIQKIHDTPTYIRESTLDLFDKLNKQGKIPHNIIACEIKYDFDYPRKFPTIANMPLYGLDYSWQKELITLTGNHYMGIQILGSLLANWFYICLGGSARLFSLLPTKNLHLWAYDLGNYHYNIPAPITIPQCGLDQSYLYQINQAVHTNWPTITWEYEH